ncbi:FAD-dependent oxidoreductase [Sporobolomyces koalae]|uniref:FAD-dependent oxidoreductase n=1 Tax=Sporobolomyces koalae TaxID=500713 RepID=UPI00317EFA29
MSGRNGSCSFRSEVLVLGAGCVGLTTAIKILRRGLSVVILAEHLPGDSHDAAYASAAAGAHHLSFAGNSDWRQRHLDLRTFDELWEQSRDADEGHKIGVLRLRQTEYYKGDTHLRFLEQLPNFCINDLASVPRGIEHSVSFDSVTIEPARYLAYLSASFEELGGRLRRSPRFDSLSQAVAEAPQALAIVNCTGLGARTLAEVQDRSVHPVRGQVVILDAPWVRTGWTRQIGSLGGAEGGERTYVIPRASGEVVVGGTREYDDWEATPRAATTTDILRRALEICPLLSRPPGSTAPVALESLVKQVVVGFRPTRDGGIRLEADVDLVIDGQSYGVVHNYGHGGYGWQSSWGCAEEAASMVLEMSRAQSSRSYKL